MRVIRSLVAVVAVSVMALIGGAHAGASVSYDVDGYSANTAYSGPVSTVYATFTVPDFPGVAAWVDYQSTDDTFATYVQAGVEDASGPAADCYYSTDEYNGETQYAPPTLCSPGQTIEVFIQAPTYSTQGATVVFDNETTAKSWSAKAAVPDTTCTGALFIVETNPTLGTPPSPFPDVTISDAGTSLNAPLFTQGSDGVPLYGYYAYGLYYVDNQIPGAITGPVSSASSFTVGPS